MASRRESLSRREVLGAALLGLLIVVVELVLVVSYLRGAETNERFGATSTLVTSLANMQREVLRLHVEVDDVDDVAVFGTFAVSPTGVWANVAQQEAILRSQLHTVEAAAAHYPDVMASLAGITVEIDAISAAVADADRTGDLDRTGTRMALSELERHVKALYDRQEIAYFKSTSDSLATQAGTQLALVVVAISIAVIGVGLGLLLRRRLKDEFAKAFFRLEAEMGERERAERALRHQAFHDALTGAPNRMLFLERLEQAVADRPDRAVAVLFVDLDDFKTINDSLGHAAGDLVLSTVAARIRSCLREEDMVARLGGDEFAVLLPSGRGHASADVLATRILEAVRRPIALGADRVLVGATIGIARTDDSDLPVAAEDLLRNADLAMYAAKLGGKNRFEMFRPAMHHEAIRRMTLRTELERAIEREEFVVHYQPIVDLTDSSIVAVEALVRWKHPERGLVPPSDFIPIAEESGLIVPIGRWILDRACAEIGQWIKSGLVAPTFGLSVNVSPRQLQADDLIHDVELALARSGMPASGLTLEMTETLLVDDVTSAAASLDRLKELGLQIAIDDFGTGYSSLSYLSRFPIDVLKIDRTFITAASAGEGRDALLARTIIGLGAAVGLPTVAEGIELPSQVALVRELGCRYGQGYFLARPAEAAHIATLLGAPAGEIVPRSRRSTRRPGVLNPQWAA